MPITAKTVFTVDGDTQQYNSRAEAERAIRSDQFYKEYNRVMRTNGVAEALALDSGTYYMYPNDIWNAREVLKQMFIDVEAMEL